MKKLFALFLSVLLLLSFCGCGNTNTASTNSDTDEIEYIDVTFDENGNNITESTQSGSSQQGGENASTPDGESTSTQTGVNIDYEKTVEVDICNDVVRGYLDAADTSRQYFWLNEYSGTSYDYQSVELDIPYDGSMEYTLTFSENADFSNAITVKTFTTTIENSIFVPGKVYYWKAVGTISTEPIAGGKLKIKDAPVRWIKIDGSANVRDMGGWKTESGKTVRYEMMYRGKALDSITEDGKETVKSLGLKTEIDIRAQRNNPNPPQIGLNYKFFDTEAQYDMIFSSNESTQAEVKANYRAIFELLSNESNYPIYTHCSAGADRTGTFAFIVNGLLGVSYEDLTRDFELTSFSNSGKRWRGNGDGGTFAENDLEMKVEGNYVAWGVLYNEMLEKYGTGDGKLSSAIEYFLTSFVGVPKAQIDSFKSIMLK